MSLGGTDIYLHLATPLMLFYMLLTGHGQLWCVAALSILLHEGAHALIATAWGSPPSAIEITPLGALMRLEDETRMSPFRRITMLLAGPAMTLVLLLAAIPLTKGGVLPQPLGRMVFIGNLGLLAMNLLPALPLDGGRVLSMLLALLLPVHAVYRVMRVIGTVLGTGLIAANLYITWTMGGWNLSLAFAGCCLLYGACRATTTRAMAELRFFLDRKIMLERQGSRRCCQVAVVHTCTVRQALRMLHPRRVTMYTVLEAGTLRTLGTKSEFDAVQHYLAHAEVTCGAWIAQAEKRQHNGKTYCQIH